MITRQYKMKLTTRTALAASLITVAVGLSTGTAQGQATVYEGFDYAVTGNTSGLNGGTGFASVWEPINVWWQITGPGSTYGSLTVAGNKATCITRSGIARPLNSDLWDAGLLDNGSTLWFSAIVDITTGSAANSNLGFALTNSTGFRAPGSDPAWHDLDFDGTTTDEGVGFAYNAFGQIGGAYWQDDDAGADAYSERVFSDDRISGAGIKLILGKIEWGVDDSADEKLSLYEPDAGLNIGTAVLADWPIPALDQGSFNRIALMGKDTPSLDEIRFGATSADVMPGAGPPCNVTFCETDPANQGSVSLSTCDCSGGSITLDLSTSFVGQFTYPLIGLGTTAVSPTGVSQLCLAGSAIGRYTKDAGAISAVGTFSVDLLNANSAPGGGVPTIGGALCNGNTWRFQYWHRAGMNPSRFSKGISGTIN